MPEAGSPDANPSNTVAWLRFVKDGDRVTRVALFQTSIRGRPVGFCFTSVVGRINPSRLAKGLLRTADPLPALAIVLIEEFPMASFVPAPGADVPLCRIGPGNTSEPGRPKVQWETAQPRGGYSAEQLLNEALRRADPLEVFDRVARGLAEAFADDAVRALSTVSGLTTTVQLSPLPQRSSRADNRKQFGYASSSPPDGDRGPGLAERLWAVLSPPRGQRATVGSDLQLDWYGDLMPFQREGVQALLREKKLLLADDMGLGKTVQVIAALRILRAQRRIRSSLVLAPASVLDQWRREIERWAPELTAIIIRGAASDRAWQWKARSDIILVSYDTLRSDSRVHRVRRDMWDVVVADEAQRIKNRNDTSKRVKRLHRRRSWALTGTPLENNEEELASIMEFVDHREIGPPRRYQPSEALRERHRELQLRRKKNDVLPDLPPKQVTKISIELTRSQRRSYTKAEQDGIVFLKSLGAEVRIRHVLELITRLKQICNADPETGESSKLDNIGERIERLTAQGHRALVFSQYTSRSYGVLAAAAHLRDFDPLTFTGETPEPERAAIIDRFKTREKHKVLVLSLRAGGVGLNLQEASYVFHLDRWWNPAVERQAEDRTHRMGQAVKVNAIKYTCQGTIEERIDRILERKQVLFEQLIDDVSLDLSMRLSRDEIFGLFGLDPVRARS